MSEITNPYKPPQITDDLRHELAGDSTIRVTRGVSFADRLRAYRIIVDGVERARLNAGKSVDISVAAGGHSVVAKIDWCGSPTVSLRVDADATATLECDSNLKGFRLLTGSFYTLFLRDQYLTLKQTETT